MTALARKRIFLSHAGEDAGYVFQLVEQIKDEWNRRVPDCELEVFCTSDFEHRFKDFQQYERPAPRRKSKGPRWPPRKLEGADLHAERQRYEDELRQYLRQNLIDSTSYVLLVTPRSIQKNSAWIAFEIDVASEQAEERRRVFFPCVAEGATLSDLPDKARMFQGIELPSQDAMRQLVGLVSLGHSD
jgi:hypothetical protein